MKFYKNGGQIWIENQKGCKILWFDFTNVSNDPIEVDVMCNLELKALNGIGLTPAIEAAIMAANESTLLSKLLNDVQYG